MIKIAARLEERLKKKGITLRNYLFTAKAHLIPQIPAEELSPLITGKARNIIYMEKDTQHQIKIAQLQTRPVLYEHTIEIKHEKDIIKICFIRDRILEVHEPLQDYILEAQLVEIFNLSKDQETEKMLENLYKDSKWSFSRKEIKLIMEYRKGLITLEEIIKEVEND